MSMAQQAAEGGQEPLLITADQLAAWLQVSVRSLWRLRSAGQIPPPLRLRKAVRWRLADIEDWLAKGCPANSEEPEARQRRRSR
ncbi:MAG: helix-turn-helix domain-containing protein [Pirellulales bacterium]|nr:helix-turn-helix domain-containing protein [Pirellulales bacterium]